MSVTYASPWRFQCRWAVYWWVVERVEPYLRLMIWGRQSGTPGLGTELRIPGGGVARSIGRSREEKTQMAH